MRGKFNCISKHFGKITLNEKDDAPRKHIEVDIRERPKDHGKSKVVINSPAGLQTTPVPKVDLPCFKCHSCLKIIEKVEVARKCLCLICVECKKHNSMVCTRCRKKVTSYQNSQEIQGLFNNLNHLIKQREFTNNTIEDLVESNKTTKDTFNCMMNQQEDGKDEIGYNDISYEPVMKEIPKPSVYDHNKFPSYFEKSNIKY